MWEQAFAKFLFDTCLALIGVGAAALALWTWQKRYWEYQLRRQTEDWKSRQSYARKEARRQSMEGLLTELNEAMEQHLIATYHTVSAIVRTAQHAAASGNDEDVVAQGQEQVTEQIVAFNQSEREWLVQSAVLEGKLRLHFANTNSTILQLWPSMSQEVVQFCELLNLNKMNELLERVARVRAEKDRLLQELQQEIDRFTASELDLPGP